MGLSDFLDAAGEGEEWIQVTPRFFSWDSFMWLLPPELDSDGRSVGGEERSLGDTWSVRC